MWIPRISRKIFDIDFSYIILHVGTNDAVTKSSDDIFKELLDLKAHIERILPKAIIIFSEPIILIDDMKANLTVGRVISKIEKLDI